MKRLSGLGALTLHPNGLHSRALEDLWQVPDSLSHPNIILKLELRFGAT